MIPNHDAASGNPIAVHSHSSTRCSSSVAAGLVTHNIAFAFNPDVSNSPSTDGTLDELAKYAKNDG